MTVNFKKCNEYASIPYRGSMEAAGYDLCAAIPEAIDIQPNAAVKISTGLKMMLPKGTFGAIFPRSGLATKRGLVLANTVGIIDADYRGEVIVALLNISDNVQTIHPSDRIAQLIIIPFIEAQFEQVENLETTERGEGGFGHSGT